MTLHRKTTTGRRTQLHRALSKLGCGSRTEAWDWIRAGQVTVDGRVITDPLTWVDLDRQKISRHGQAPPRSPNIVLALHKPRGVVTTRRDERGRRTVYDLLPTELPYLFPVGRLDADSEGLLILTNDSALAHRLTEPVHHVPRTYQATVSGKPSMDTLARLRQGLVLPDSPSPTRPAAVRLLHQRTDSAVVEMTLTEGRNRQIRRMWKAVGHRVKRLVRTAIGRLTLDGLEAGGHRLLDPEEIERLKICSRRVKAR